MTQTYPYSVMFTPERPIVHAVAVRSQTVSTIPESFAISGPYPNPFNPETRITLDIPTRMAVKVDLFNVEGRFIRQLVSTNAAPGHLTINVRGNDLPSGVYFVHIAAGSTRSVRKALLLR